MTKKNFLIAVSVLILDQLSKSIIEVYIKLNESITIINNFFNLTVAHNTGGAWSIFNNHSYLFIIFSLIAVVLLINLMFSFKKNKRNNWGFMLLIGGILSNLCDRIFLGYVRDFLDFKIFNYDYPIFNIADMAIVMGVILLIIAIIKGEDKVGTKK